MWWSRETSKNSLRSLLYSEMPALIWDPKSSGKRNGVYFLSSFLNDPPQDDAASPDLDSRSGRVEKIWLIRSEDVTSHGHRAVLTLSPVSIKELWVGSDYSGVTPVPSDSLWPINSWNRLQLVRMWKCYEGTSPFPDSSRTDWARLVGNVWKLMRREK